MRKVILFVLVFMSSLTFGQTLEGNKKEKVIKSIVGTWVFADGTIKGDAISDIKLNKWHTDTISFFADMTMKFFTHDPDGVRRHEGHWDLSHDSKTIILENRIVTPPFSEPVTDVRLPFKLTTKRMVLTYPIALQNGHSDSPSAGQKRAEIIYVRMK